MQFIALLKTVTLADNHTIYRVVKDIQTCGKSVTIPISRLNHSDKRFMLQSKATMSIRGSLTLCVVLPYCNVMLVNISITCSHSDS